MMSVDAAGKKVAVILRWMDSSGAWTLLRWCLKLTSGFFFIKKILLDAAG